MDAKPYAYADPDTDPYAFRPCANGDDLPYAYLRWSAAPNSDACPNCGAHGHAHVGYVVPHPLRVPGAGRTVRNR